MELPIKKWYESIATRHSRRRYLEKQLDSEDLQVLSDFTDQLNEHAKGFRISLIIDYCDRIFKGMVGSYGSIKGAPACGVFIIDENDPHCYEKAGYYGEAFILEATSWGLGTCWVGATFDQKLVEEYIGIGPNEKIIAITPVGYVKDNYTLEERLVSFAVSGHKRKPLKELCIDQVNPQWPEWVKDALQCARRAPSALNRQPWRFRVLEDKIIVSTENKGEENSNRLNCGIAMLHLEIGALYHGVYGKWNYLEYPDIAEYTFKEPLPVLITTYYGGQTPCQQKKRYRSRLVQIKEEKYSITNQFDNLPAKTLEILKQVGNIAKANRARIYLVGGVVRDLFLSRENRDFDLVVTGGEMGKIITEVSSELQGEYNFNDHFRTGSIKLPDGFNLDLAETRRERYLYPGVLPEVEVTTDIMEDLFRRDYTVNALALDITPDNWGELLDPFQGYQDIKKKVLRTLHRFSFLDDPTRIIRGIRLAYQLGFNFEKQTGELIEEAITIGYFSRLAPVRVIKELELLFGEKVTPQLLEFLVDIPVFRLLNLDIKINQEIVKQFSELERYLNEFRTGYWKGVLKNNLEEWVLRFALFLDNISLKELENWRIKEDYKKILVSYNSNLHLFQELNVVVGPVELVNMLKSLSMAEVIVLLVKARDEQVKNNLKKYLQLSRIKREITGTDLLELGFKPGPVINKILNRVYQAKLRGEITTREEELAYVRRISKEYI